MGKDKSGNDQPNQPVQSDNERFTESVSTESLTIDWTRSGYVSNTMPAPPNPNQSGCDKDTE